MSTAVPNAPARTYEVKTHGCQMNVHDSERLSGLLEDAGYVRFDKDGAEEQAGHPDVVVFNTCAVRENADNKLYGNLGQLAPVKAQKPGMQIAVGGCLAQKDRETITKKAPWVDVVFGTHNIGSLPVLLERARVQEEAQVEILESLSVFPSTLPTKRESAYAAWVSISVGCNNTCTFCIVPALRGKEKDRRPGEILAEVEALVAEGVTEVTLLGQNVNAYGVEFGDRQAFSKLLRACGEIEGLERVRFTSPHPAEFTDDVIEAMAETPNVMPSLHMPLQSGSDKVLRDMRRSYRQSKYLGIIERVRAAIPDAAITTDIIVGFPGETEEDFQATLDVVRGLHLPVLQAPRHPGRDPARPGLAGGRQGPLPAPRRRRRGDLLVREQGARRSHRRADGGRGRGSQGQGDPPAVRSRARQSAGALRRRLLRGGRRLGAPRRHGHGRDHLRRPAPPRGRRRDPLRTPHPRRRRLGAAYVRPARAHRRGARHAVGRRTGSAASGAGLRLTPRSDAEGPDRQVAVGALRHPRVSGGGAGTAVPPRTPKRPCRGTSARPCGSCTGCARSRSGGTSHRS
jgi:MiaB/RimO family radical SAM methylthiotransferase